MKRRNGYITRKINESIVDFDSTPFEINSGQCRDFAERVQGVSKKKGLRLLSNIDKLNSDNNHCFIKYKKKYYDAEAPKGVSSPKRLPFFVRRNIIPRQTKIKS